MSSKQRRFEIQSTQPSGGSLLDELTGVPPAAAAPPAGDMAPSGSASRLPARPAAPVARAKRVPIRVQVPEELADRVRGAVAALAYRDPNWSSLNAAAAAALEGFVAAAEAEHNDGERFPWEPGGQLQPGRRVGHWVRLMQAMAVLPALAVPAACQSTGHAVTATRCPRLQHA